MDRVSGLNANQLLRELQTYSLYKNKTQKEIKELIGNTAELRDELRRLEAVPIRPNLRPTFIKTSPDIEYEILPTIRCIECNTPIGKYAKTYERLVKEGWTPKEIFERYNISRECCREKLQFPPQISTFRALPLSMSKLSLNPLLTTNQNEYVKVIEGTQPAKLKQKVNLGKNRYDYIDIQDVSALPTRQIYLGDQEYSISYK